MALALTLDASVQALLERHKGETFNAVVFHFAGWNFIFVWTDFSFLRDLSLFSSLNVTTVKAIFARCGDEV
jgi:hypothetical protein